MADKLMAFVDQIFSINSTPSAAYGSALAVGNRSPAAGGSATSAGDIIYKLRSTTSEMAEAVKAKKSDTEEAITKAKTIEGCLLNLQVLGQISPDFCNTLINNLHDIVKY